MHTRLDPFPGDGSSSWTTIGALYNANLYTTLNVSPPNHKHKIPLYTRFPVDLKEVDVIIAGGGTAGCIVAARLAEADTNLSIMVIEGGANNEGNPIIQYPAFFLANMSPESKTNLFVQGVKEDQLGGREVVVPTGGTLGGGSATNFMMYSRASRSDYDGWEMPGWG